jgi:hypothetical protein
MKNLNVLLITCIIIAVICTITNIITHDIGGICGWGSAVMGWSIALLNDIRYNRK